LAKLGIDELHGGELVQDVGCPVADQSPGDPRLLVGRVLDSRDGRLVEGHHVLQHADGLEEGTEGVVLTVRVLLQEVVLEHLGHLQRNLVLLIQGRLTHQLDDFGQVVLLLQHLLGLGPQLGELRIGLLVVVVQGQRCESGNSVGFRGVAAFGALTNFSYKSTKFFIISFWVHQPSDVGKRINCGLNVNPQGRWAENSRGGGRRCTIMASNEQSASVGK